MIALLRVLIIMHNVQNNQKEADKMAANTFLPLEKFTIVVSPPESRNEAMFISITENGRFNLNGKLAALLHGKPIQVRFTDDGKHLCLLESTSKEGISFPKSGSRKLDQVMSILKSQKITIPAKYSVRYDEVQKIWQGDVIENPTQRQTQHVTNSKKRS